MHKIPHIYFQRIGDHDLPLPAYHSEGASGLDLRAHISHTIRIDPGQRCLIGCGFAAQVPNGMELQIRPRSGLALRYGITVLNAPGTIDSDYRGEIMVLLMNHGDRTVEIHPGDRIAQMVAARVQPVRCAEIERLQDSVRHSGGFGSTGTY